MSTMFSAVVALFVMAVSQCQGSVQITQPIGNKLISLGDPLKIVCEHTGAGSGTIGFKQGTTVIQNGVNRFEIDEKMAGGKKIGTLSKAATELTDSGKYVCMLGSDTSSVFITVFKVDTVNGNETDPTLQCKPQLKNNEDVTLEWLRDDQRVESDDVTYKISENNEKLEILNKDGIRQYMGVYECKITKGDDIIYKGEVYLNAKPEVDSIKGDNVIKEDEDLRLTCSVSGSPEPQPQWYKDGAKLNKSERLFFTGAKGEILLITDVKMSDSGEYSCRAIVNGTEKAVLVIMVKVKDKLAALWPTIGILLEILVLILIIGVSEYRKRGKNKPTASYDTDDEVDEAEAVGGDADDGEVRHRPTHL